MYEIIDQWQDIAGKWRVRVWIAGQVVMLKFATYPEADAIQAEAAAYESAQVAQDVLTQGQADAAPNPE